MGKEGNQRCATESSSKNRALSTAKVHHALSVWNAMASCFSVVMGGVAPNGRDEPSKEMKVTGKMKQQLPLAFSTRRLE